MSGSKLTFAEELTLDSVYLLGSYTIDERQITDFGAQWDPLPLHLSEEGAANSAFGGLIASGLQTLSVYQRLAVTSVLSGWSIFAGRRFIDVRFLKPVRPGDTLTGYLQINSVEFTHPDRALVTTSGWLDVSGERTLELQAESYVHRSK